MFDRRREGKEEENGELEQVVLTVHDNVDCFDVYACDITRGYIDR